MPQIGWTYKGNQYTHEEMIAYASEYPVGFPFTPEMIEKMHQGKERDYVSPTTLHGCARKWFLQRTHDYYENLEQTWHRFRGTIAHEIMEAATTEPDAVLETKRRRVIETATGPVMIEGTPDKLLPGKRLLLDYKTVKDILNKPKEAWIQQLSCYRWMFSGAHEFYDADAAEKYQRGVLGRQLTDAEKEKFWLPAAGIEVDRARIQMIDMPSPGVLEIPLWDLETTETWLAARAPEFSRVLVEEAEILAGTKPLPRVLIEGIDEGTYLCKNWCPVAGYCRKYQREGK